jgi:hypothetical protein
VLDCERILQHEERLRALLGDRGESSRKIVFSLHLVGLQGYAEPERRACRFLPGKHERGIGGIPEHRGARQSGHDFLEDLQALCARFGRQLRPSREISAGVAKAVDQAGVQRIDGVRVHDRNGLGRVHDGKRRRRRDHDDDVDVQPADLLREVLEALGPAMRVAPLDEEVAPLLIAVFAQGLEQRVIEALMAMGDERHVPDLARLLREPIERPGRRGAKQGDEIASSHGHLAARPGRARASRVTEARQ